MALKDFRGEVWTNVHSDILSEMVKVNLETVDGNTGNDVHSKRASELMQRYFKDKIYTTYTINGTAANVLALKSTLDRWSTVICAGQTHVNVYECGAFEYNLGNKILTVDTADGKLNPTIIDNLISANKKYKYIPKVVVLTEPTEFGTLYTVDEIKNICDYAHERDMFVYIDGARISNALVALNVSLTELIEGTGVDAFSFGGTKAGAMFGEMIVFRRKEFSYHLDYLQKQSMQHLDKSKFLGVQMEYLLDSGLWKENAIKSNAMAKLLESKLVEKGVKIFYPVQTNTVFCVIDEERLNKITRKYDLHYWNVFDKTVRICLTYLTTEKDVLSLAELF